MILAFFLTILIVGFVTAGLNIKFDRFFTILLLLFIFGLSISNAINIFLWVIMFGALMVLLNNKRNISNLSKKMKVKLFVLIPLFTSTRDISLWIPLWGKGPVFRCTFQPRMKPPRSLIPMVKCKCWI